MSDGRRGHRPARPRAIAGRPAPADSISSRRVRPIFSIPWFESEHVKALFAFDGIVGAFAAPSTPGTAYVLLHHCFGEVNGKPGVWGHAVGGMGAITQAMARAAQTRGAVIRLEAPVARRGRSKTAAPRASSSLQASSSRPSGRRQCRAQAAVPRSRRRKASLSRHSTGAFHEHQDGLRHVPHERRLERAAGLHLPAGYAASMYHHGAGIVIGPTIDYLERAYLDARATAGRASRWSRC